MDLNTDIRYVKGVGDVMKSRFHRLGIDTVEALLYYFPRDYEDWSAPIPITDAVPGETCCVRGTVISRPVQMPTRTALVVKAMISDGHGLMQLVYFGNKYIVRQLPEGETFLFYGKVTADEYSGERQMLSPRMMRAGAGERLHPIYRQTEGLTSKKIEQTVEYALSALRGSFAETLPEYLLRKHGLMGLEEALRAIHLPRDRAEIARARDRLVFEELLDLQLAMMLLKTRGRGETALRLERDRTAEFLAKLPFTLTGAQRRCIDEAMADLRCGSPMNRLVQGDVGSGKTAVAAALIYSAVKAGWQCAMMAPTELLAQQHYETMTKLFGEEIPTGLVTGSTPKAKRRLLTAALADGSLPFAVGTHALLSEDVQFANLGLVVTDEQHRFGVRQRTALAAKGATPHTLVMSATPIPRTLGLIIYGDLDVSIIDELPAGRKPVETYAVTTDYHDRIYKYIKKFLDAGRQAYVVCPLVEESEESDLIPAEDYYEYLRDEVFDGYRVGLLHGKMKPKDKAAVMEDFVSGRTQLLVSTVVIEVGIDVPNATVMVIENAERFGLSQLHQLRGRIGRGAHASVCILISDAGNDEALQRLRLLTKTNDGFVVAQEDLKMRGPGDFLGARQHGLPELRIANIVTDTKQVYAAREQAQNILLADPDLSLPEHRSLAEAMRRMYAQFAGAGIN